MCFMFGANKEQVRHALGLTDEVRPEPAGPQDGAREETDCNPTSQRVVVCDHPP